MCYFGIVKNCRTELVLVFLSSYVNPEKAAIRLAAFFLHKNERKKP